MPFAIVIAVGLTTLPRVYAKQEMAEACDLPVRA